MVGRMVGYDPEGQNHFIFQIGLADALSAKTYF